MLEFIRKLAKEKCTANSRTVFNVFIVDNDSLILKIRYWFEWTLLDKQSLCRRIFYDEKYRNHTKQIQIGTKKKMCFRFIIFEMKIKTTVCNHRGIERTLSGPRFGPLNHHWPLGSWAIGVVPQFGGQLMVCRGEVGEEWSPHRVLF